MKRVQNTIDENETEATGIELAKHMQISDEELGLYRHLIEEATL